MSTVVRNRIICPYRNGPSTVLKNSIPGYSLYARSPGGNISGATQNFTVASVPADLSTLIVNGPDGKAYTFQFVYAGSVNNNGIPIPLPAAGGSTATQVATAVATVLSAGSGTPFGGSAVTFPWILSQPSGTHFTINWTIAGLPGAPTGTQATITVLTTAQSNFVSVVVPSSFGPVHSLMPG